MKICPPKQWMPCQTIAQLLSSVWTTVQTIPCPKGGAMSLCSPISTTKRTRSNWSPSTGIPIWTPAAESLKNANAAYAKGGPEQALSMLNTNLDLAITDYVTVDFSAIVECVDLLGGVEMTITDDEASLMLGYIQELNRLTGNTASCPSSGGTYTLNGVQATAFARIRYGGGDDYKRTERQRAVLSAMIAKAQKSDLKTLNALINTLFSDIQTSFSNADLLALATNIFNYKLSETNGFPYEKTAHRYDKVGDVVIPCDLSSNVTALHQFLYTDMAYTPSDTVKNNSEMITSKTGYREGDGF